MKINFFKKIKSSKFLSKRARILLKEIKILRSQTISAPLSQRALKLLKEINTLKAKDILQPLSAKAREILDEINSEKWIVIEGNGDSQKPIEDKKLNQGLSQAKSKEPGEKQKLKTHNTFKPQEYRNLSASAKLPIWIITIFILSTLSFFTVYKSLVLKKQAIQKASLYEAKVPKLKKDVDDLKLKSLKLNAVQKSNNEKINPAKKEYPNEKKATQLIDDIIRLFEVSHLIIISQDISYINISDQLTPQLLPYNKPEKEKTIFSGTDLSSNASPGLNKKEDSKPKDKKIDDKRSVKSSGDLNFMSIRLSIKGTYSNYMLVRNTLTRIMPSVNIPSEEIIVSSSKNDMDIRLVLNIPFIMDK